MLERITNFLFEGSTASSLSPQQQIEASNEIINIQGEAILKATENINSATSAANLVGDINTKLSTRKIIFYVRRLKRQIVTCTQFETKYEELLDLLIILSDDDIVKLDGIVEDLKDIKINTICDEAEKTSLKQKTESKVTNAVSKGSQYVKKQNEKIDESKKIIEEEEKKIEENNEIIVDSGGSSIPAATTPVIPTTIAQGNVSVKVFFTRLVLKGIKYCSYFRMYTIRW